MYPQESIILIKSIFPPHKVQAHEVCYKGFFVTQKSTFPPRKSAELQWLHCVWLTAVFANNANYNNKVMWIVTVTSFVKHLRLCINGTNYWALELHAKVRMLKKNCIPHQKSTSSFVKTAFGWMFSLDSLMFTGEPVTFLHLKKKKNHIYLLVCVQLSWQTQQHQQKRLLLCTQSWIHSNVQRKADRQMIYHFALLIRMITLNEACSCHETALERDVSFMICWWISARNKQRKTI